MEWLASNEIAFYMVFTKADKLKPGAIKVKVDAYCKEMTDSLWETHPPYFITSSTTQEGCAEILQEIDRLNRELRGNL
jgi:GTP-binding protein